LTNKTFICDKYLLLKRGIMVSEDNSELSFIVGDLVRDGYDFLAGFAEQPKPVPVRISYVPPYHPPCIEQRRNRDFRSRHCENYDKGLR
jgi:hypothetical protein